MNTERLKEIESFKLDIGKHKKLAEGACVMELVSYINNEPWSDHPACACPILTEYAIRLNDRFNDKHRQLLKPFIPLLIGTKLNDQTQIARKKLLMWRNVTAVYPLFLDLYKLPEIAEELRSLKNTSEDMDKAKKLLIENREKIYKAANAYANANADAYAYAYALREKLVSVAIETFKMAIEVKVETLTK